MCASSPVCCSRNHHGSRAGSLLACSPCEYSLGEHHPSKAFCVGMLRMTDPALYRRHDMSPFHPPSLIGLRQVAIRSRKPMSVIAPQPTTYGKDEIAQEVEPVSYRRTLSLAWMEAQPIRREPLTDCRTNLGQLMFVGIQHHHVVHVAPIRPDLQHLLEVIVRRR